jgi:hypothetical protein
MAGEVSAASAIRPLYGWAGGDSGWVREVHFAAGDSYAAQGNGGDDAEVYTSAGAETAD